MRLNAQQRSDYTKKMLTPGLSGAYDPDYVFGFNNDGTPVRIRDLENALVGGTICCKNNSGGFVQEEEESYAMFYQLYTDKGFTMDVTRELYEEVINAKNWFAARERRVARNLIQKASLVINKEFPWERKGFNGILLTAEEFSKQADPSDPSDPSGKLTGNAIVLTADCAEWVSRDPVVKVFRVSWGVTGGVTGEWCDDWREKIKERNRKVTGAWKYIAKPVKEERNL